MTGLQWIAGSYAVAGTLGCLWLVKVVFFG